MRAAQAFSEATRKKLPSARTEIQDGGLFLLLSVEVPSSEKSAVKQLMRAEVAHKLNSILPANEGQTVGSWLVIFTHEGEVYDSILPYGV